MSYGIDPQKIVHETIDGEVILIHLQTGNYYSLGGSGAAIWSLLAAGATEDEVVSTLRLWYEADPGAIEEAVESLVSQLVTEELLEDGAPPRVAPPAQLNGERVAFAPPALEKYTDMQDFLLVDPIHEVGETGWPATPAG
jgi:hypothetical protein